MLLSTFFLCFGNPFEKKNEYQKEYGATGEVIWQGWLKNGYKTGYWRFYHYNEQLSKKRHFTNRNRSSYRYSFSKNGKLSEEGHHDNGIKANWRFFYDVLGNASHKFQWTNGKKNGYCLLYKNNTIIKAQKYQDAQRLKAWSSYSGFKNEHKLSDLR